MSCGESVEYTIKEPKVCPFCTQDIVMKKVASSPKDKPKRGSIDADELEEFFKRREKKSRRTEDEDGDDSEEKDDEDLEESDDDDNDDDADGIADISETSIGNNVLNNLDPPRAAISSQYILGIDNRTAGSSAFTTLWDNVEGGSSSSDSCDNCIVPGTDITTSAMVV